MTEVDLNTTTTLHIYETHEQTNSLFSLSLSHSFFYVFVHEFNLGYIYIHTIERGGPLQKKMN
jgi:hypothetical protein